MLTELVENMLNRNLGDSPAARNLCAALRGQRLFVIVSGLDLRLGIESLGSTLRLQRNPEGDSHATLEGSPLSLVALAGPQPERQLQSGAVQIRGDAEVLQRYRELALLLRPDLEEELARLIGDAPAHSLGRMARSMLDLGRRGSRTARCTGRSSAAGRDGSAGWPGRRRVCRARRSGTGTRAASA